MVVLVVLLGKVLPNGIIVTPNISLIPTIKISATQHRRESTMYLLTPGPDA